MTTAETLDEMAPLRPVITDAVPTWEAAVWIGEVSDEAPLPASATLVGGTGFARARFMVRHGQIPRGFVELDIADGRVSGSALTDAIARLPVASQETQPVKPPISIIICTKDRPEMLRKVLATADALEYDQYEVVVVDNGPTDPRTRAVVESLADPRIRIVDAPIAGLARARNVGVRHARYDILAFTDDDVYIDAHWLNGIARGLDRSTEVGCVCGIVPSVEINSVSQWYFDHRVNWANSCEAELFDLRDHRPTEPLFPFQVGRYGTGANFAVTKTAVIEAGGFDEGFGVGSPTGGGEDIDMFVRLILAGWKLAYEPSAIVWHKHRADDASLHKQMSDYGMGLGAWLTKLALQPRSAVMIARRLLPALLHLNRLTKVEADESDSIAPDLLRDVASTERRGVRRGPMALLRARRAGGRARPLDGLDLELTRQ